jgi:hypothetical protein
MKKSVIAILTATIILLSFLGPALYKVQGVDPTPFQYSWYTTVNGVLDSDYYSLYPFEKKSVNFGFSKFGELLGIPNGLDPNNQNNWVGMEYDGRDPFAPPVDPPNTINMTSWVNGWYIDIQYIDPIATTKDRHLFAFAMFADGSEWGGDWKWARTPDGEPHGGRKTNGSCTTEVLKILYNGPRRFVAQSVTHVKDKEGQFGSTWDVLDVTITMIFDKVKKQVILLKDVKIRIQKVHLWDKIDVQFSNREEYDLGPSPSYASFAHFYEQWGWTCYGPDWHYAQNLTRDTVEHQVGNGAQKVFTLLKQPVATGYLKVYVNGVFQYPGLPTPPYSVNWNAGNVTFNVAPPNLADVMFNYKYVFKEAENDGDQIPTWDHKYDIAQVISSDGSHVAWTAMWPCVSDYTVDGLLRFLYPLIEVKEPDMSYEPKQSPLIIGEWDFLLDHAKVPMFRCVEVKGICNRHDADDTDAAGYWTLSGRDNWVDIEPHWYQLPEVFMPWDLESATKKDTERWVQFYEVTSEDVYYADLGLPLYVPLDNGPVIIEPIWEAYAYSDGTSCFSERVLWGGATPMSTLRKPIRSVYSSYDYELYDGYMGYLGWGYILIPSTKVPVVGTLIKILYSTYTLYENLGDIDKTWIDEVPWTASLPVSKTFTKTIIDPLAANHTLYIPTLKFTVSNLTRLAADHTYLFNGTMDFYEEDFKVFKEGETLINAYWWDQAGPNGGRNFRHNDTDGTIQVDFWGFRMQWYITPPDGEDLHVDWLHLDVDYDITVFYNATTGNYTITTQFNVNGDGGAGLLGTRGSWIDQLYVEHVPGRYEWGIVGRGASSVDSAGLGDVTAAFKNKQIEYDRGGVDMYNPVTSNQMEWVMRKFGTGNDWEDYYKNKAGTKPEDKRTALRDHWCGEMWMDYDIEPVAIASSNMIGIGGCIANVLAYYGNDFTEAFFALGQFTDYTTWKNKIVALTCWNGTKKGWVSSDTEGYAVITTYKDINGTVLFLIWGHWGRDTRYACEWFHKWDEGIYQLQEFDPCVTSIILKIDYESTDEGYKPIDYTVIECLGTISETLQHSVKGGIHDP